MIHRHHDAQEWLTLRQELLLTAPTGGFLRSDIDALVYLADMAREGRRLPPAARRVVMSAALEFATDEEAAAVYPPPSTTTTEATSTPERRAWVARIARIATAIGIPLDPDAIDDATTINIGTIRATDGLRLALLGNARRLDDYAHAGMRRWHIEIDGADDGEPVTATVLT